jgi:hypothetical protein
MKSKRFLGVVALLVPALVAAQQMAAPSTTPVIDAAKRIGGRYSGFLIASAEQVPADKLGYKPTPAQLSFGDVWAHLVEANFGICAAISGSPAPADMPKVKGTDAKDALVNALKASFTYCDGVLAKANDTNLGETVDLGFMKASRASAIMIYLVDLSDHYSQVSNYMRLNGMLPPSAQPKKTS